MIAVSSFKRKKLALFGLGGSGLAAAKACLEGGADIIVWDDNAQAVARAQAEGLQAQDLRNIKWSEIAALVLSPGVPLTHPAPHWSAALAHKAGVEIIGDIELFVRERNIFLKKQQGDSTYGWRAPWLGGGGTQLENGRCKQKCAQVTQTVIGEVEFCEQGEQHALEEAGDFCPFIAITGTNGKSTTTALIAHILRQAGFDVQMGGNIGRPILELEAFKPSAKQVYVVECSSYQIDLAPSLNPDIGILLNITPDHIDRHGSFKTYAAVKERLAAQSKQAVIAYDDAPCQKIYNRLEKAGKRPVRIVTNHDNVKAEKLLAALMENGSDAEGLFAFSTSLNFKYKGGGIEILCDLSEDRPLRGRRSIEEALIVLRGQHNAENALAALATCRKLGVDNEIIVKALHSFKGLPHRMESVGCLHLENGGVIEFVNDSKATNAEAVAPALQSFENIYWIAGGIAKQGGIESLVRYLPAIQKAYLIGEAAEDFAKTLEPYRHMAVFGRGPGLMQRMMDKTREPYAISNNLQNAVRQAVKDAKYDLEKGHIWSRRAAILLSPACASFDQFKNFEERGKAFAALTAQYCKSNAAK